MAHWIPDYFMVSTGIGEGSIGHVWQKYSSSMLILNGFVLILQTVILNQLVDFCKEGKRKHFPNKTYCGRKCGYA